MHLLQRLPKRALRRLLEFVSSPGGAAFLLGLVAAAYLVALTHQFTATFGATPAVVTGLAAALALGLDLGGAASGVGTAHQVLYDGLPRPSGPSGRADLHSRRDRWAVPTLPPIAFVHIALAAWCVAFPWLLALGFAALGGLSLEALESPAVRLLVFAGLGTALMTFPAWLLRVLPKTLVDSRQLTVDRGGLRPLSNSSLTTENRQLSTDFWLGAAAGLPLLVFAVVPLVGVAAVGWSAALVSAAAFAWSLIFKSETASESVPDGAKGVGKGGRESFSRNDVQQFDNSAGKRLPTPLHSTIGRLAAVAIAGGATAAVLRGLQQLMPWFEPMLYVAGSAVIVGVVLGARVSGIFFWRIRSRGTARRVVRQTLASVNAGPNSGEFGYCRKEAPDPARRRYARAGLLAAFCLVAVPACFPWLVELSLTVNAFVSNVWLAFAARSLIVAACLVPLGFLCGTAAAEPLGGVRRGPWASAFALGFGAAGWWAVPAFGIAAVIWICAWLIAVQTAAEYLALFRSLRSGRKAVGSQESGVRSQGSEVRTPTLDSQLSTLNWRWAKLAALLAVVAFIAAGPWMADRLDPVRAARMLFGTQVYLARQRGVETALLAGIDESRPVASLTGRQATWTLWRQGGARLELRADGIPAGAASTRTSICPHDSAEMLQAALPLVLHGRPDRVLLLGLGSGVSLTTALASPVLEVVCAERDPELQTLVEKHVWSESGADPRSDARLRFVRLDPLLALAARDEPYDVIVSTPPHSAMWRSAAYFTVEFYRQAAQRLRPDGVFCQRFQHVDYGPAPLATIVRTMQAVFGDVAAVEIGTGETALLAAKPADGLKRDGLIERFQAPHARSLLAGIGWDWSVPLNLAAWDHRRLARFAADQQAGVNTRANGRFAFRLPREMMRWGPKWRDLQQALAAHRGRLLEVAGADGNDPVLLRRLSEVAGQRKLMTSFPDQWWAYRQEVRQQVTQRPRSLIRQVSGGEGEGRLHPEDRRRMAYFKLLAEARRSRDPEDISRVAAFAEPYDPLLSYFCRQELAELIAHSPDRDLRAEMEHRLHAIYFAHAHDRSVRNVAAALKLLAAHPEATATPLERWDHLGSLLQELKSRWEVRGLVRPKSARLMLADIEHTLSAAETALEAMAALRRDLDLPEADWQARRAVLERYFLRPLETYRTRLETYSAQQRRRIKKLLDESDSEPQGPADGTADPRI